MDLIAATIAAGRDRLRPILMTSLAFGLGVLPLAIATGAGSGAQRAIGTGVLGGMIVGTFLGIVFIPLFFVVVQRLFGGREACRDAGRRLSREPGQVGKADAAARPRGLGAADRRRRRRCAGPRARDGTARAHPRRRDPVLHRARLPRGQHGHASPRWRR